VQGPRLDNHKAIQELQELLSKDKDIQALHLKDKDIPVVLHLRDKDIQELHHRVTREQEGDLVLHPKDTQEPELQQDRDMVGLLHLIKAMVEELHLTKPMVVNKDTEEHHQVELHRLMVKYNNGSMRLIKIEVARLTPRSSRGPWSMGTGVTSARRRAG